MQVPILTGIFGEVPPNLTRSYPVNMIPVAENVTGEGTGISKGYLRLAPGVETRFPDAGHDRGGYVWKGAHLRVIDDKLYRVGTSLTALGTVGNDSAPVSFAEGFGRIAIRSAKELYYWDGSALTRVTDPDLGPVLALTWSDGYYLTSDGTSLVATELNDPTAVDPLRYGSSEADPDPVQGLLALRGEVFALNRYSIESFINAGTTGFPFQRQRGAQIPKGCVGPDAFCPFVEAFAFVGSARNEESAVYLAGAGQAIKLSPRALDEELAALPATALAAIQMESFATEGLLQLLVHLPERTWVYHWVVSQQFDVPVWSVLEGTNGYAPRHFTLVGTDWWCGSTEAVGVVSETAVTVFGEPIRYRFDTPLLYNEGRAALVHDLQLVTLGGRGQANGIGMRFTDDGLTWTPDRFTASGRPGDRDARPAWRRLGRMREWRGFRFSGIASSPLAFLRLEARIEPLGG